MNDVQYGLLSIILSEEDDQYKLLERASKSFASTHKKGLHSIEKEENTTDVITIDAVKSLGRVC